MIIHTQNPSQFYCCRMKTNFLFVAINVGCSKLSHHLPQKTTLERNGLNYELFLVRDWNLYFIWWEAQNQWGHYNNHWPCFDSCIGSMRAFKILELREHFIWCDWNWLTKSTRSVSWIARIYFISRLWRHNSNICPMGDLIGKIIYHT